jgi:hypothetical protein
MKWNGIVHVQVRALIEAYKTSKLAKKMLEGSQSQTKDSTDINTPTTVRTRAVSFLTIC